jgi:hypothetical protein
MMNRTIILIQSIWIITVLPLNAQFSIGLKTGFTSSLLTDLENRKSIGQNATYEVKNLNTINFALGIGYKHKKVGIGIQYGNFATGFKESAVFYSYTGLSGLRDAYIGQTVFDYSYDVFFSYTALNVNLGYDLLENLSIKVGVSSLKPDNTDEHTGTYSIDYKYSTSINSYQIDRTKYIEVFSGGNATYNKYGNDIALTLGIDYKIYKGLHIECTYLRNFKRLLEFPSDNNMYNQALTFDIGYQWTFKKRSKY